MESFCSLSGHDVFEATISLPRTGCWRADLLVSEDVAPAGKVTLNFGSSSWSGFVFRGGAPFGTGLLRIVGGAGGLGSGQQLPAKSYQGAALSLVLKEILSECGESLSSTSDASVLNRQLSSWTRTAGPAGNCISQLLSATGASWRFLPDGSLWVGLERWPADGATWQLIVDLPQHGKQVLYSDDPTTKPGSTIEGRRVSYVEHHFTEEMLRTAIWYEDAQPGVLDRIKNAFAAFIRAVVPVDPITRWSGLVVSQNGGLCDFQGDDPRIGGLQNVKIYWGEPGMDPTVNTPARAILGFLNGDLAKPYIAGWEDGTTFSNLVVAAGKNGVARDGDTVSVTLTAAIVGGITAPPTGGPCMLTTGEIQVDGTITSGSSQVQVG